VGSRRHAFTVCRYDQKANENANVELTRIIGNGLNIVKVMPESAIKFGTFEAIKRAYAQFGVDKSAPSAQFVGGV
jgi:hypothetical protein